MDWLEWLLFIFFLGGFKTMLTFFFALSIELFEWLSTFWRRRCVIRGMRVHWTCTTTGTFTNIAFRCWTKHSGNLLADCCTKFVKYIMRLHETPPSWMSLQRKSARMASGPLAQMRAHSCLQWVVVVTIAVTTVPLCSLLCIKVRLRNSASVRRSGSTLRSLVSSFRGLNIGESRRNRVSNVFTHSLVFPDAAVIR